ncbi:TPA: hypothetical protein DIV48_01625 [Candidatus Kaiserbacteria bacterium]|nr:MAG: hypothetical protein UY93_C0002G0348 [Parcubacteria group bacterium GW2011_GWA1_56_13]KKW46220.1 MAG: hypothetical protein UY97_C0008G0007 [Parcubacteria group bacterium GW2011_GWB1_57_6]HCR52332.1 hypothetical protein [Candidatus Kaiserbacteria bacterium]
MADISEQQFQELFQSKLGVSTDRALDLFRRYDVELRRSFVNVLLHASEQKKIEEILGMLEKQYESDHRARRRNIPA